jgi:hypothetical protein
MPSARTWFVFGVKSVNLLFAEVNHIDVIFLSRGNFSAEDINTVVF